MTINTSVTESAGFITLTAKDVRTLDQKGIVAGVKSVREAEGIMAKDREGTVWNAALLYGAAKDGGLIGKADGTVWNTQGDYAAACGFSPTMGTIVTRLHRAQVLGIRRDSKDWTFLVKFAGGARVGKAVADVEEGAGSAKRLHAALAPLMEEAAKTGKVAGKTREPQPPTGEGEGEGDKSTPATPAAPAVKTPQDVIVALHALRVPIHELDREGWAKVEDALTKMVADETHRRTLLAAKEAKAAKVATPADVAKVAKAS